MCSCCSHCLSYHLKACSVCHTLFFFFNDGNEEDFRRTACTSLLQHVVETSGRGRERAEDEDYVSDGKGPGRDTQHWTASTQPVLIPNLFLFTEVDNAGRRSVGAAMIDMALRVCQQFLSVTEHYDIDVSVETPSAVEQQQWADFLQDYYMVVQ